MGETATDLPTLKCKRGCSACCGPVPFSDELRRKVQVRADMLGVEWRFDGSNYWPIPKSGLTCPFVRADHKCAVYDARPMLCRLYGVTEGMACEIADPPSRYLSDRKARKILNKENGGAPVNLLSALTPLTHGGKNG